VNENRLPREMITKTSLMNAAIALSATAASTNAILHLLAIATEAGVYDFDIDAFDTISRTTPVIGDLKPGGKYMAYDLYAAGGSALIGKRLVEDGRIEDMPTVTGRSIFEEISDAKEAEGQDVAVTIDVEARTINVDADLAKRAIGWIPPKPKYPSGAYAKFARLVGSASKGAVTSFPFEDMS